MDHLLSSGKITRIVNSREISVPINLSGCIGELFKPVRILDLYPDPIMKLSLSPGLTHAFLAAGLVQTLDDPQVRIQQLLSHEYLMNKLQHIDETITANEIIESTLLHHYQITSHALQSLLYQEGLYSKQLAVFSGNIHKTYLKINAYITI